MDEKFGLPKSTSYLGTPYSKLGDRERYSRLGQETIDCIDVGRANSELELNQDKPSALTPQNILLL
jgi:hypothetical protein